MYLTQSFGNKSIFSLILFIILISGFQSLHSQTKAIPFSTDSTSITIWNGEEYVPLFIKGINLGISKPGTFPGQLAATRGDYGRWLEMIREAGYNSIRLYTLHYPRFYEVLDSFNTAHPNEPLLFFQGIWLEEEIAGYDEDLFSLTPSFNREITENINSVHGNAKIPERRGKAYGNYTSDVSRYLIGYILGREIHPPEVLKTNYSHAGVTGYNGSVFSINNVKASEAWMAERLNYVVEYENDHYNMQHPVSFSSWPTLDPLYHPFEPKRYEDSETIDLSKMDKSNAPAGYFASYHAYPYYPDFVSRDPAYQGFSDYFGQNSYIGYLTALKEYYKGTPLIIAEFGSSSSWGIAHYSQNGIHHGGSDELQQGYDNIRMFRNIEQINAAGGIQFAWIDEWFKPTWITDPIDGNPERRVLWHNITAAEQNFGIIGFKKKGPDTTPWEEFCTSCPITGVEAGADYSFLHLKIKTNGFFQPLDTLWVAVDTYADSLGEKKLPGGQSIAHRSEFLLKIYNETAQLLVTEAYDLFGIWHNTSSPEQKYRSTSTEGAPWRLTRWKNNNTDQEIQYIGNLQVNRLNLPVKSTDAVKIDTFGIDIRIPWSLINFTDPSQKKVLHDYPDTSIREDTTSNGIALSIFYNKEQYSTTTRFSWDNWNFPRNYKEYKKASYDVIEQELNSIKSSPVARVDSFNFEVGKESMVNAANGILINDWSLGGEEMNAYLVKGPDNGALMLNNDGSFIYQPVSGFSGADSFVYKVQAGNSTSTPVRVYLTITGTPISSGFITIYPNPGSGVFNIESAAVIDKLEVLSLMGSLILEADVNSKYTVIDLSNYSPGAYFIRFYGRGEVLSKKVIVL